MSNSPVNKTLSRLAHHFAARVDLLGLKGKKRDEFCLEFFAGAATALTEAEHPDAKCVTNVTMLLIATRGYSEVASLIGRPVVEEAA